VHDADITSVDLARRVGENLESASPDLLRAMVQAFAEALMGAEADALYGAPPLSTLLRPRLCRPPGLRGGQGLARMVTNPKYGSYREHQQPDSRMGDSPHDW
jgi:hypothetical protein